MKYAIAIIVLLLISTPLYAAPALYRIDPVHSQVLFTVSHDGFSNPVGRLHVQAGWLRFDPDDWSHAAVEADVDTTSVDLGDADWDAAVRGHALLDAAKWPQAHFVSTSMERTGPHRGLLHGTLTLRGVSRPLTISVRLNRRAFTIFGAHTIAGFSGSAVIDRTDFGMTGHTGSISREVDIRLEIEAILDADARRTYQHHQESAHAAEK